MPDLIADEVFNINRYMRIRKSESDLDTILFGSHPPLAFKVRNPPEYFLSLLQIFNETIPLHKAVSYLLEEYGLDEQASIDILDDLRALKIIVPPKKQGRYDRHELYFEILGVGGTKSTEIISKKCVGIVGTGGIGSTVAMILSSAGIGSLVVSDGDIVEESNLTRSILFDEANVSEKKILAAKNNISNKNSKVDIKVVDSGFESKDLILEEFKLCDFIVLSADHPKELHKWIDEACYELKIPYITAGYVESFGSIGPLIVPDKTACFECSKGQGLETAYEQKELNQKFQAPSYGPLNLLVASIAANETLRYLLQLENETAGKQILIDSQSYGIHSSTIPRDITCPQCGTEPLLQKEDKFSQLVAIYEEERNSFSLNKILLDDLILSQVINSGSRSVLDVGCATGEISISLAKSGLTVTALDISKPMIESLERNSINQGVGNIETITGDFAITEFGKKFDYILLNLVLDYMKDPNLILKKCNNILNEKGYLLISIPHPFKDSGTWNKKKENESWVYESFIVQNYFNEGKITKCREDHLGNVVIDKIESNKWTLESYFKFIIKSGFSIESYFEPKPNEEQSLPVCQKASKIPYFAVFICKKN